MPVSVFKSGGDVLWSCPFTHVSKNYQGLKLGYRFLLFSLCFLSFSLPCVPLSVCLSCLLVVCLWAWLLNSSHLVHYTPPPDCTNTPVPHHIISMQHLKPAPSVIHHHLLFIFQCTVVVLHSGLMGSFVFLLPFFFSTLSN